MPIEIDINKFQGVGVYTGDDGKEYLIMVDKKLSEKRKEEIIHEMVFRKINIKDYLHIPEKEVRDRLRNEWR